jgi:anti-sigma B factor antagonist
MFEIRLTIKLTGRFDADQEEGAKKVFSQLNSSAVVDFSDLEYISSAGLGVLLAAQQRLRERGETLELVNLNAHIRDLFNLTGFHEIFEIR